MCLVRGGRPDANFRLLSVKGLLGPVLVLAVLAVVSKMRWRYPEFEFALDVALGLAFAVFFYCALEDGRPEQTGLYARVSKTIAGFSFTLYAINIPFLVFARLCLAPKIRWTPDASHLASGSLVVGAVILAAFALSQATEAHTDAVRRAVLARLGLRR